MLAGVRRFFGIGSGQTENPPNYVHLKEAKIMRGMGGPINVEWWRGRLEAVDGFSLGGLDA
jgi:hypothetical protein